MAINFGWKRDGLGWRIISFPIVSHKSALSATHQRKAEAIFENGLREARSLQLICFTLNQRSLQGTYADLGGYIIRFLKKYFTHLNLLKWMMHLLQRTRSSWAKIEIKIQTKTNWIELWKIKKYIIKISLIFSRPKRATVVAVAEPRPGPFRTWKILERFIFNNMLSAFFWSAAPPALASQLLPKGIIVPQGHLFSA